MSDYNKKMNDYYESEDEDESNDIQKLDNNNVKLQDDIVKLQDNIIKLQDEIIKLREDNTKFSQQTKELIENMSNNIFDIEYFLKLSSFNGQVSYLKSIDLNLEYETKNNNKPIHFICSHSTPEMIKYIIDIYIEKGLNLECETNDNYKPIHFICGIIQHQK